jgi:tRNA wybutosine-synthesizing protein 2
MFSIGNITEKLRIASFDCKGEVVVDLFAGIGYFVLPYLVHAKAQHVFACEINPDSIAALRVNLKINGVEDRCTIFEGDNRTTCPSNIADRVNLGLIPSSEISWRTACNALKSDTGGVLHVHANIDSSKQVQDAAENPTKSKGPFKYPEWEEWTYNYAITTIKKLLCDVKDRQWFVKFIHLEHVKSYAPHVDHVVLDLDCRPAV